VGTSTSFVPPAEETQILVARQSPFSCESEYTWLISQHTGPVFPEYVICLFSLSKIVCVSEENARNYTRSIKHTFIPTMKMGSSVWRVKTPQLVAESWLPALPGRVTHLLNSLVFLLAKSHREIPKISLALTFLSSPKVHSLKGLQNVNAGVLFIYLCTLQGLSQSWHLLDVGWLDGWIHGWKG
jgi:hypothetical protein